ncbi:hypothetical protein BJX63DRAFT_9323 [Aspergillus granulosus]|uniref:Uncharacterized protein n=1 Tax=Aspergillus granulosus TaxID=176169 RepID=A0ABR4HVB6_9EURO
MSASRVDLTHSPPLRSIYLQPTFPPHIFSTLMVNTCLKSSFIFLITPSTALVIDFLIYFLDFDNYILPPTNPLAFSVSEPWLQYIIVCSSSAVFLTACTREWVPVLLSSQPQSLI